MRNGKTGTRKKAVKRNMSKETCMKIRSNEKEEEDGVEAASGEDERECWERNRMIIRKKAMTNEPIMSDVLTVAH